MSDAFGDEKPGNEIAPPKDGGQCEGVLNNSNKGAGEGNVWEHNNSHWRNELLRVSVEQSSVAAFWIDQDANLVYVNDAACRSLGYTHEELLSMAMGDIDPAWSRKRWDEHWNKLKSSSTVTTEISHRRKDMTIFPVEAVSNYIEFDGHAYDCSFARDITSRRQAERALGESEEKYSSLVESSLTGIYIDLDGKVVFANNKFAEIYGYPKEELIGLETWRLVHPDDRAFTNEVRARRLEGKDAPIEYSARGLKKNNKIVWVTRRNTCIEYEGKPAILGNVVDISAQKQAQEQFLAANEELRSFVHAVSHDLRSPIISIQGLAARLCKACSASNLGDQERRYLSLILSSAKRMEALVSDLSALSKIGRVETNYEVVSSNRIARNVANDLLGRLEAAGVTLVVESNLPDIYCDEKRIYQVLENLVVNAIKFRGENRAPRVEIGYEDKGVFHRFYVKDNGIGIDQKHHRRIFELFQRLQEIRDDEGTGLGLTIVEKIVKNHGGEVWVESEKGQGATFYFTLAKENSNV